jgi:cytochrome c556
MKNVFALLVLMFMATCSSDRKAQLEKLERENKILKEIAGPLPARLDNYYPPKSNAPIYLIEMLSMSTPFEGIGVDLQENDISGAMSDFESFKLQYQKISNMVAEWKDMFPLDLVDSLGLALSKGDQARIGKAMAQIGDVCSSCHLINQIKAQQKFHWPDFDKLTLSDPIVNAQLSWHDFMMGVAASFSGISTSLQQGQLENARRNFQVFSNRFSSMAEGCYDCHSTPRTYYTDESVRNMIKDLGNLLDSSNPDQDKIQQMIGAIGNEGCLKCHYLHMPSVVSKMNWKNFETQFKEP